MDEAQDDRPDIIGDTEGKVKLFFVRKFRDFLSEEQAGLEVIDENPAGTFRAKESNRFHS